MPPPTTDPQARFNARVDRTLFCWNWTGRLDPLGYGRFWVGRRMMTAHRYAFIVANGPLSREYDVHHTCRNRRCVNPDHLQAITPEEHGRLTMLENRKGYCRRGHAYTEDNTRYWRGIRICKACRRQIMHANYLSKLGVEVERKRVGKS